MIVARFPDPIPLVRAHLLAALPGTPIVSRVPNPRPAQFVQLMHTGGSRATLAHQDSHVTVLCWATDPVAAFDLAADAYAALDDAELATGAYVPRGDDGGFVGGIARLDDLDTGTPRYQFTAVVRCRTL